MNIIRNSARACAFLVAAIATSVSANTVSISAPASVTVGDTFNVTVIGDFPAGLFSGGLVLGWDDPLLDLNSVTQELAIDPAFSCPGTAVCVPDTASTTNITFSNFAGLLGPGAGPTLVATLSFTATAAGVNNFTAVDSGDGWFDAGFANFVPGFTGASVTVAPIPVPAAVWLFGSGLLGLIGVARRKAA